MYKRRRLFSQRLAPALILSAVAMAGAKSPPWDLYRLYLKGLVDQEEGRWSLAVGEYQEVLRRDPAATLINEDLTDAAMASGQIEVALASARALVAVSTGDAGAHVLLGRVLLARGDDDGARAEFDRALSLDPTHLEALGLAVAQRPPSDLAGVRRLYENFLRQDPEADDVRLRLAEVQHRLGDGPAAEDSFKKVLESDPGNTPARLALAGLYEMRSDTGAAVSAYEAVLQTDPRNAEALRRWGRLCLSDGRYAEAHSLLARAAVLSSSDRTALFWLSQAEEGLGRWAEAEEHLRQIMGPESDPGMRLRLSTLCAKQGKNQEALGILARLQKENPDSPDLMHVLGLAYEDLDKPRAAVRWYRWALKLNNDLPETHFRLGALLERRGRLAEAEVHFRRVLTLDPDNAGAMNYLGYSWADRGQRLPEALDLIQRALAQEPTNPAFLDSLGWVYHRMGRQAEAEKIFRDLLPRMEDPILWSHFGAVLNAEGKTDEAVRAWQDGLAWAPDDPDLLRCLKKARSWVEGRTALKRAEGNFRRLRSLSAVAVLEGTMGTGRALFYYARPGRFRVEPLLPLGGATAMIFDGSLHGVGPEWGGRPQALFALWASVWGGEIFSSLDAAEKSVSSDGKTVTFHEGDVALRLRMIDGALLSASNASGTLDFAPGPRRGEAGIPAGVTVTPAGFDRGVAFRLKSVRVNPSLSPELFSPRP